jgi:hypothetical protein
VTTRKNTLAFIVNITHYTFWLTFIPPNNPTWLQTKLIHVTYSDAITAGEGNWRLLICQLQYEQQCSNSVSHSVKWWNAHQHWCLSQFFIVCEKLATVTQMHWNSWYTVPLDKHFPKFQMITYLHVQKQAVQGDEDAMIMWHVKNYPPIDTASHPRGLWIFSSSAVRNSNLM